MQHLKESETPAMAKPLNSMPYVVVRTFSAGVHIGYLKSKDGQSVALVNSRRLHYWEGAASLSQVAMDGVSGATRLAMTLPEIMLEEVIEVIPCSLKAQECLEGFQVWKIETRELEELDQL